MKDHILTLEIGAERLNMAGVSGWLERKLRLKVSASKTKVVRPTNSTFLGFNFWKSAEGWKPRPAKDRKAKLCEKVKAVLRRKRAAAVPLWVTFVKLNQILRGWINYFRIGSMKGWLRDDFGPWMRHKVRVVILKQWKRPKTIYRNLMRLNTKLQKGLPLRRSRRGFIYVVVDQFQRSSYRSLMTS